MRQLITGCGMGISAYVLHAVQHMEYDAPFIINTNEPPEFPRPSKRQRIARKKRK